MRCCFSDTETFCETPIKNGTFAYAEKVEVLLWSYAFDNDEVKVWDVKAEAMPLDLKAALSDPECLFIFHNYQFDTTVIREGLGIEIPIERVRCSMARAYAHALPGSLYKLGSVLGLSDDQAKDKEGKALIRLFCVPPPKKAVRKRGTPETHPKEWEKFKDYAKQDIVALREIWKRLPDWNYKDFELKLWMLDAVINRRGLCIDVQLASDALRAVDREQERLRGRTEDLTFGDISSTTKRDQLMEHIVAAYGVELNDMTASTVEKLVEDETLPIPLRELLAIRLQATTSSTAKYKKVISCVSRDGRLRGTLQWCGASRTGRDGGRLFQPQNLPRPTMKNEDIERGITALKNDRAHLDFPNVMSLASNALRGLIVAPEEKKLVIADLSNIEGRYAAWIGGEAWKLDAFRAYDAGQGPDIYKLAYAKMFGVKPEDVTKDQRQVGKTAELALGFGGGVKAFVTFALAFGSDLEAMAKKAEGAIAKDIRREAEDFWKWADEKKMTYDLSREVFVVCDSFKRAWRRAHPGIVAMWSNLDNTIKEAIATKDKTFEVKPFKIRRSGNWLRILMPSGRSLCYPSPQVDDKGKISFSGTNQFTRQWGRISTYGPKCFENLVQGGARDVFMAGVVNAENDGYEVVARIHDEIIAEVPSSSDRSVDELCRLMTTNIPWVKGLPLAAAGFETKRYRKD